jgi:membrane-associated phospholipid phosphatase
MEWISYISDSWRIALVVLAGTVILWQVRDRKEAIFLAGAGVVTAVHVVIKWAVGRPRPSVDLVKIFTIETSESYPSGHAFAAHRGC